MTRKQSIFILLCLLVAFTVSACKSSSDSTSVDDDTGEVSETVDSGDSDQDETGTTDTETTEDNEDTQTQDDTGVTLIQLNGTSVEITGDGAVAGQSIITISSPGTYRVSGSLADGQIIVDVDDEEGGVALELNGVDIACSFSAPVNIKQAGAVSVILGSGTENYLTDTDVYVFDDPDDDEPDAALFSKADLTIDGQGSLNVTGMYNDGIKSKDGLIINNGNIQVNSVDDGIMGKDYVVIDGGTITVDAAGDGIKSTNDEDTERGYITITGGTLALTSGSDAIQAETNVLVSGGELTLLSGNGSSANLSADDSAKGIKAVVGITISGGIISIDSADDSIHSNDTITIDGGTLVMSSGDDGIHADSSIVINGGDISIDKSYEGIESAAITINDGTIHLVATDDGLNVAGGNDGSSMIDRPGRNNFSQNTGNYYLAVNGGYCFINSAGDGVDINGSGTMTNVIILVSGPTSSANGALDYDGSFSISGGMLVAAGSSGMAQVPDSSSSQPSVLVNFTSQVSANTLVNLETAQGGDLFTFAPAKAFQSIVFSLPGLSIGTTCNLYYGGSHTGTKINGLYQDGDYSPGNLYKTFTVSQTVTTVH